MIKTQNHPGKYPSGTKSSRFIFVYREQLRWNMPRTLEFVSRHYRPNERCHEWMLGIILFVIFGNSKRGFVMPYILNTYLCIVANPTTCKLKSYCNRLRYVDIKVIERNSTLEISQPLTLKSKIRDAILRNKGTVWNKN